MGASGGDQKERDAVFEPGSRTLLNASGEYTRNDDLPDECYTA